MPRTGSCLCRAVEFELADASSAGVLCYCSNCRKTTSDRSYNIATTRDAVTVTKGAPAVYHDTTTKSALPMARYFCSSCGSPLWSDPESQPSARYVKVGALDDAADVRVVAEVFVDHALAHGPMFGQKHFDSNRNAV
ncbi:hypothetical protein Q8F55_004840 [Vanrija albida]|uniref:CENP-V/GFA domain-containing protein n=1 Tax=Vanrija albida TaxID=181172 RepID=A0ABR3Q075_9TREE